MKSFISIFALLISFSLHAAYQGSSVSEVWQEIVKSPYSVTPTHEVTAVKVAGQIFTRAQQTVDDRADLIPYFDKLLHSNGTCMLGKWEILQDNPYSGYFKKGSQAVVIARASTTLSGVKRGEKRGFGMALKLFPTNSFVDPQKYETAQIFTIDTLAGNRVSHYMKSEMTNFPKFGFTLDLALGLIVGKSFALADAFPMLRQVYQVSELGEQDLNSVITPKYFKVQGAKDTRLSSKADFRDELTETLALNGSVRFDISVAGKNNKFQKIGRVDFYEIVASEGCDHRLHFHHPKFRYDLRHTNY